MRLVSTRISIELSVNSKAERDLEWWRLLVVRKEFSALYTERFF